MRSPYLYILLLGIAACAQPDARTGPVIDASRNVAVARYYPTSRPDQPFPRQTLIFVRHFYYASRPTQWTIFASGETSPVTRFEQTAVYLLRLLPLTPSRVVRLMEVPGFQTDGVTEPHVRLAIAAPTIVNEGGEFIIRNTNGSAIVYVEDGPLYGGISVDIPDTVVSAERPARLLVAGRVRAAALSSDGQTVAYSDAAGRLFTVDMTGQAAEVVFDLRAALGPVAVTDVQWDPDPSAGRRVLIRLDRGFGPEAWGVFIPDRQLIPNPVAPRLIQEPGSDRLPEVDRLTREVGPGEWRVPDPRGFSP